MRWHHWHLEVPSTPREQIIAHWPHTHTESERASPSLHHHHHQHHPSSLRADWHHSALSGHHHQQPTSRSSPHQIKHFTSASHGGRIAAAFSASTPSSPPRHAQPPAPPSTPPIPRGTPGHTHTVRKRAHQRRAGRTAVATADQQAETTTVAINHRRSVQGSARPP